MGFRVDFAPKRLNLNTRPQPLKFKGLKVAVFGVGLWGVGKLLPEALVVNNF